MCVCVYVRERARGVRVRTRGVRERARGVRERARGVRGRARGVRERARGVRERARCAYIFQVFLRVTLACQHYSLTRVSFLSACKAQICSVYSFHSFSLFYLPCIITLLPLYLSILSGFLI